ncbi:hypothetical protein DAKH74_028010 [Maudiozyma humilis]|uniref:Uncharacterized protein n=1 Tax=Maudiozyma humilis TaxID=51915 RepID=A0AAV5RX59_MAUHU|nr:hypothetical protein DAKH74_028010 [Kazachstania humilis]
MDLLDMFNGDGDTHGHHTSGVGNTGVNNGGSGIGSGPGSMDFQFEERIEEELFDRFDSDFDFIDWLVDKPATLSGETNGHSVREVTGGLYQQVTQSMVDLPSNASTSPFDLSAQSPTSAGSQMGMVSRTTSVLPWPSSQSPPADDGSTTQKTAVRRDRVPLKRTKSNPFYSPSKQIRNLVSKSKRKSSLSNLQKSYSTDVLPLGEQNVNVKRHNDDRKG